MTITDRCVAELKRDLRGNLLLHQGPDRTVTQNELVQDLGLSVTEGNRRYVRRLIREMLVGVAPVDDDYWYPEDRPLPVASNGRGYFVPETRGQVEEYADRLKGMLIEDARRRRDFRRAADLWFTPGIQRGLL